MMRYVLLMWIAALAVTCPYTKVEESFNMQAAHDLLHYGLHVGQYDHLEFPGVVPRTFLGAMAVSLTSSPLNLASRLLTQLDLTSGDETWDGETLQLTIRLATGLLLWLSYCSFQSGVSEKFGGMVAEHTALLTCLQFHLPFYMSRTLPNTLALALCLCAYGQWLRGRHTASLLWVGVGAVILRCDLLVLLAPMALQFLMEGKVPFWRTLGVGVATCAAALLATVCVDSFFWRPSGSHLLGGLPSAWLWPEGVVLFFNTLQNKSSEWGTHKWHWYFSSAIPRSLHICIPLAICGVLGLRRPRPGVKCIAPPQPAPSAPAPAPSDQAAPAKAGPTPPPVIDAEVETTGILLGEVGDCFGEGLDTKLMAVLAPVLAFVALYSILPHKELRFIFPALPVLTIAGAVGLSRLLPPPFQEGWERARPEVPASKPTRAERTSGRIKWLLAFVINSALLLLLPLALAANGLFLVSSVNNYPGGDALKLLLTTRLPNEITGTDAGAESCVAGLTVASTTVHIGVAAAMSGVTRFGQAPALLKKHLLQHSHEACRTALKASLPTISLEYSKKEGLTAEALEAFQWLLASPGEAQALRPGAFAVRDTIYAFHKIVRVSANASSSSGDGDDFLTRPLWRTAFAIELSPAVLVLQRTTNA